jgi:hypothetical protein
MLDLTQSDTLIFDLQDAKSRIGDFIAIYRGRPVKDNRGGMSFNHSFATWYMLLTLRPESVIESGIWKGHSTWLIEQACPQASIYCLDIDFSRLEYKSKRATYLQRDFAQCDWSSINPETTVAFFDDHQNAYARLKDMYWSGIVRAIFEDNFPCGEGDCYSLRHILNGYGHRAIQMSDKYRHGVKYHLKKWIFEKIVRRAGARQQLLVEPNTEDRSNFLKRARAYVEFPPVIRKDKTQWGTNWTGYYESEPPLMTGDSFYSEFERFSDEDPGAFDYGYIAYVELDCGCAKRSRT